MIKLRQTLKKKKKSKISQTLDKPSPNLEQAIQNKIDKNHNSSLEERIEVHQAFFQFYGKNYSPLMAGIIMENCEIIYFSEEEKKIKIYVLKEDFQGNEELQHNLKSDFAIEIVVKKNISNLDSIKMLYKKQLIEQEMQTEDFKKVLAKFPNAKIIDIEDMERGDGNDG
jgi:hypothetical protein